MTNIWGPYLQVDGNTNSLILTRLSCFTSRWERKESKTQYRNLLMHLFSHCWQFATRFTASWNPILRMTRTFCVDRVSASVLASCVEDPIHWSLPSVSTVPFFHFFCTLIWTEACCNRKILYSHNSKLWILSYLRIDSHGQWGRRVFLYHFQPLSSISRSGQQGQPRSLPCLPSNTSYGEVVTGVYSK